MQIVPLADRFAMAGAHRATSDATCQLRPSIPSVGAPPHPPNSQDWLGVGTILMCDFAGYRDDEIGQKYRPVIVVAPPKKPDCSVATVVPVSQASHRVTIRDVFIESAAYPCFSRHREHWAKVHLVSHVSVNRLDRILVRGRYTTIALQSTDLDRVLIALRALFSATIQQHNLTSQRTASDVSITTPAADWVQAGG